MAVSSIDSLMNPNEKARVAPQKTMGQEDFLKLLTTQMQNQDPTNPVDNTKMIADMAQFSSLEAMKQLNDTVSSMSQMFKVNQAVQASVLVGKDVVVPGSKVNLVSGSSPVALVNIEEALTEVKAQIRDASGTVVREYAWDSLPIGQGDLKWDGKDASGNALPQGAYTLTAWGTNSEGARAAVGTLVAQKVTSVDVGSSGATLNLADGSSASLDEIQQIR
ncbi:MAG: flagellar hook assembly protein FlgD [Gammaproteobacteria bacterium]|nr:flagellar hook assembly protein FlgD [Gammaproteobacteria bacterium]